MGYSQPALAILFFIASQSHDLAAPSQFIIDDKSHRGTSQSCIYPPFTKRQPLLSRAGHLSGSCEQ